MMDRLNLTVVAVTALSAVLAACGVPGEALVSAPEPSAASSEHFWITNITLVDPIAGRLIPSIDIAVRAHVIDQVQQSGSVVGDHVQRIDGTGKFLMPGLWDMHVHIADAGYLTQFVANGVLGVRDMGGGLEQPDNGCESLGIELLATLRDEVVSGVRVGPDMVLAGAVLSGTGWPTSLPARSPAEAGAAVEALYQQGVDFVKTYEKIPRDAYVALAAAANSRRLPFAGHVPEAVDLLLAIESGARSIEHLRDALLMCFTDSSSELEQFFKEDNWGKADRQWGRDAHAACPYVLEALRSRPTWVTPTLVVEKSKVAVENPAFSLDTRRDALPASVRAGLLEHVRIKVGQDEKDRRSEHLWWRTQQVLVGRLGREGVRLLAGTDAACEGGLPGHSLHDELEELVAAGLSPQQALRSAITEPAHYLDRTDEGAIEPGMRANLLILRANPLEDIRNTREIDAIILKGRLYDRSALDVLNEARP